MKFLYLSIIALFLSGSIDAMYSPAPPSAFRQVYYEGGANTYLQMGKYFASTHPDDYSELMGLYFRMIAHDIKRLPCNFRNSDSRGIYSVAWSPTGKRVAAGAGDGIIRLYKVRGGSMHELRGHADRVGAVVWSPRGKYLASGSLDGAIRLWDITKKSTKVIGGHEKGITSLSWNPVDGLLLSSSFDGRICMWDVAAVICKRIFDWQCGAVNSVAWNLAGDCFAAACADGTVRIWNIKNSSVVCLKGHAAAVRMVAWSPDGTKVASCSNDYTIRIWDVQNCRCERILRGHNNFVKTLAWTADGKWLISGSINCTMRLWNVESGLSVVMLSGKGNPFNAVAISPDGDQIVVGACDEVPYILSDIQPYMSSHRFTRAVDSLSLYQQWTLLSWFRCYKKLCAAFALRYHSQNSDAFESLPVLVRQLLLNRVVFLDNRASLLSSIGGSHAVGRPEGQRREKAHGAGKHVHLPLLNNGGMITLARK